MRAALLVAIMTVLGAEAGAGSLAWTHARPTSPHAACLLRMATERSALVRALVEDLERTDVVAYLIFSRDGAAEGARDFMSFMSAAGGRRYVAITIYWRPQAPIAYVPALAHELQHALELADATGARDGRAVAHMYGTIGWQTETGRFETARARSTQELVRQELARGGSAPGAAGGRFGNR